MDEMTAAIDAVTSPAVKVWMDWMLLIFAASLVFVWKYPAARWALGAFVLSALLGLAIFTLTREPHLIGISHVVLWGPLSVYLYKQVVSRPQFKPKSLFGIWVLLLLGTIVISLVFDIRDIILVLFGMK